MAERQSKHVRHRVLITNDSTNELLSRSVSGIWDTWLTSRCQRYGTTDDLDNDFVIVPENLEHERHASTIRELRLDLVCGALHEV